MEAPLSNATSSPDAPCAHCGLPVGRRPIGNDPFFCCTGCQVVYQTLQAAGMGETYYRLRGIDRRPNAAPARTSTSDLMLAELDTETFLTEHTRESADGCRQVELFLDGVHCAACVWLVERLPYEIGGVSDARLDLARARLTLTWDPGTSKLSDVARWLARFGYQTHPLRGRNASIRTQAERRLLVKAGVAWALAGNIMLLAFALYAGLDASPSDPLAVAARWLSLALAIPAVVYAGGEFFVRAWRSVRLSLRNRSIRTLHMDTPIALGVAVGFAHSTWATATGRGDVWFDSIAVLIAALLTARWLQLRSRRLAGDAGERLLSLIPTMVRRRTVDGRTMALPAADLVEGDLVEVPAGEVIPVDGIVHAGSTTINNAVITGETRLERVEPGTAVSAGATNVRTTVLVSVRASGDETRVGQLLAWVRDGERRRAPVVLLADRLAGYFVATVLTVAILTAGIWIAVAPDEALMHVVALLVITCPCALGMATPLAMAVSSGKAARTGIFIKTDEAVQSLSGADCIVLDKTGTITKGSPALASITTYGPLTDREAVSLAAHLEQRQVHPIARSLVTEAERLDLHADDLPQVEVETVHGCGISAELDGQRILLGRPDWAAGASSGCDLLRDAEAMARRGLTPVAMALGDQPVALFGLGDRVRPDAAVALGQLRARGCDLFILSGDHPKVVNDVAAQVGIQTGAAYGGLSPEDKEARIRDLRTRYESVVMVGDGVNDAAALQAAHVGVAVHGGSTVSMVAADVFITREGVLPLIDLLDGSRRTMRTIHRNLGISLAYNVLGAAAAIAGIVTPLIAAIAMPVSSLFVVASSIAQRSFRASRATPHAIRPAVGPSTVPSATHPSAVSTP